MFMHPDNQIRTVLLPLFVYLLIGDSATGSAQQPDPTIPSPQIASRMDTDDAEIALVDPANRNIIDRSAPFNLRLKAMVLRDSDNGTAIVELNDSQSYVVTLRRLQDSSIKSQIYLGGKKLDVIDFTDSMIVLRATGDTRQFVVH